MKCVVITTFLLVCLSFKTGQALECPTCAFINSSMISFGNCSGEVNKKMCSQNQTTCATFDGHVLHRQRNITFNVQVRGCTSKVIGDMCTDDEATIFDFFQHVVRHPMDYNIGSLSGTFEHSMLQQLHLDGLVCRSSAGMLQTSVIFIAGFYLLALFAKQS